jgi:RNA recognition motif-containing protein
MYSFAAFCVAQSEEAMSGSGDHDEESYVVKLRGLPWSTTVDEILKFFSKYKFVTVVKLLPVVLYGCDIGS